MLKKVSKLELIDGHQENHDGLSMKNSPQNSDYKGYLLMIRAVSMKEHHFTMVSIKRVWVSISMIDIILRFKINHC
jgi:hypothetical protein